VADKEDTNTLSETKSRFGEYSRHSDGGFLENAKAYSKSHKVEIAFGSCCLVALVAGGVFVSSLFGYGISAETNALIADKKLKDSLQQLDAVLAVNPFSDVARFNRARILTKLKRRQDAVKDFDVVLQHSPSNIEALERRSALLIILGQYDQALADCNKLVDLQKEHASVYTYANRAVASAMLGKNEDAINDYSCAIRMKPSDSSFFLGRANVYREMHKYSEALEDLEWVTMLAPGNVEGLIMQSQIYASEKNYPKALGKLNEGIKVNPNNSKLYLERGKFVWSRSHSKDALVDFSKAVTLDPKNNDALLESMRLNSILHNDREALKAANLLVMNGVSTYEVQMTRADLEAAEKRYAIAALGYESAAQLKPQEIEPLLKNARALAEQNKFDQSAQVLTKTLAIKPADPVLLVNRADYLRHAKDFEKAQADYEKALALKPDLTDAHMGLGVNYCEQGDYKNAKTEFETVLRAKPKAADALNFLAFAKRGLTNFGKLRNVSVDNAASASSVSASDPKVKALVATGSFDDVLKEGVARYNSGSYNAAISLLSRAVKLNPNATSARRYLAKALVASGYNVDAISQYRAVISQEPGDVDDLTTLAKASADAHLYEDAIDTYGKLLEVKPHDLEATCGLIQSYKSAGLPKKAQEVCRAAIRSANGLSEIARYESLLNTLTPTRVVAPKPFVAPQNPANIQG
jgi:tetratricopeptide (TPR) repeat protein